MFVETYKIITDPQEFRKFLDWLPDLKEGECYYVGLFARKKYHPSAINDKAAVERFTATSKRWLWDKIAQLEAPIESYVNKQDDPIHPDALALYITVNPRSFAGAQRKLIKTLADTLSDPVKINKNPYPLAMTAVHQAKSRTVWVDFDFDGKTFEEMENLINCHVNPDAYQSLETRGGFHLLVDPSKVQESCRKTWYKGIASLDNVDVVGDNLIPVAGCTQGGFTPRLMEK